MEKRTIFKALSQVQSEISRAGIGKNDYNKHQQYKFRGIDAVLNALAPILASNKVLLIPSQESCEIRTVTTSKGSTMNHCKVIMDFTFYDEHGDSVTHRFPGEAMDSGDKSVNKACTAAYKYFLFEALCIPVEGTPDADSETHEVGQSLVSQDDYKKLEALLSADEPMPFHEFKESYSEDEWNELFNLAPQGKKTKMKQACRDLERKVVELIDSYEHAIKEAIDRGESIAIHELELTKAEKRMVWARLTDIEQSQMTNLMKEAA